MFDDYQYCQCCMNWHLTGQVCQDIQRTLLCFSNNILSPELHDQFIKMCCSPGRKQCAFQLCLTHANKPKTWAKCPFSIAFNINSWITRGQLPPQGFCFSIIHLVERMGKLCRIALSAKNFDKKQLSCAQLSMGWGRWVAERWTGSGVYQMCHEVCRSRSVYVVTDELLPA